MNAEIFAALAQLEKERGIPQAYMIEKITQALVAAYKKDKVGYTISTDESVVASTHSLYLEEIVHRIYRLKSVKALSGENFKIHCPNCGCIMEIISRPMDAHKRSLYACPKCR